MNALLKTALAVAAVGLAAQASAQVTFYEHDGFQGRSFTTEKQVGNFEHQGFNDRASSVSVTGERWEVCDDSRFQGRCVVLRPGQYPSLAAMGLNDRISSVRPIYRNMRIDDRRYAPAPVVAQVTFYEMEGFNGRSFTTETLLDNFQRNGFNDRASSIVVSGPGLWEVCEDARFNGRCVVLRPGQYPSLAAMGLNDRVSSVRAVNRDARFDDRRYAPAPQAAAPVADFRRRHNERLYEANVTSVRAVLGTPEQRCWVEREQIAPAQTQANVPAAIFGAVIGGVLGHQVGGGVGKDIATVGGAVAGGMIGANVGRGSNAQPAVAQNVQRCEAATSQARPQYWDVAYNFRNQDHHVQMSEPPAGPTVTVNEQGEPRK